MALSTSKGKKSKFSNYLKKLDMGIYTPGQVIVSTYADNSHKTLIGASISALMIAGFAVLLKSMNLQMKSEEFYKIMDDSSSHREDTGLFTPLRALDTYFQRHQE
ncbi:MAG: hypothetical protein EBS24_08265 [Chitinophagia bacterium]|nr:hypothetical protein [Chitinophagia bacterium]